MAMNDYTTTDYVLAAYLLTAGFAMERVQDTGKRKTFVFKRKRGVRIENAANAYYQRKVLVEPQAFSGNLKMIKGQILAINRQEQGGGRFSSTYNKRSYL